MTAMTLRTDSSFLLGFAVWVTCCTTPMADLDAQIDERWTVKVAGRTASVRPDGTFRLTAVPSDDNNRDFIGDDIFRLTGIGFVDGEVRYVESEPFAIRNDPDVPGDHIYDLADLDRNRLSHP